METIEQLIADLDKQLASFRTDYAGLGLREKVLHLVAILRKTRQMNIAVARESGCNASDARERIRLYFQHNVGVILDAPELEIVAGISEYGRRIRELRVQDGYSILSCHSNDVDGGIMLRAGQHILLRTEPDTEAARRWHIANRIRRKSNQGSQSRILEFLKTSVGQVVTSEELQYVARAAEFGRRTRELRSEQGYAIATHFTGRPDLQPGEYVLESSDRVAEPHDRHIPEAAQREVYERDHNMCRACGWNRDMWTRDDPRSLELHHVEHHMDGGKNTSDNLLVLCNRCHDEVHAGRLDLAHVISQNDAG